MLTVAIIGGAGFIGSHMVKCCHLAGHRVVVLDDLSTGHADSVLDAELIVGDLGDRAVLDHLFTEYKIDAVMHFAAHIEVGESVKNPAKYYQNNFTKTLTLLDAMIAHHVRHFIFSSTAAIFGEPQYCPIDEDHPKNPINPYGRSKLMVELVLADYDTAYGLKSICLRYFNAAGADPSGRLAERHNPETHLIPIILQAAQGERDAITIAGTDYDTPDGTCIRDYIHVNDLCSAHLLALEYLMTNHRSDAFNLGNGQGFSVRSVIEAVKTVADKNFNVIEGKRRPGDPARLIANSEKARERLKWQAQYVKLETIVEHAFRAYRSCCDDNIERQNSQRSI